MERIAGRDDESWRQENDRNQREREAQERYRTGESLVAGRRSHDEREPERVERPRSLARRPEPELPRGRTGDTAGSYERLQSSQQESGPSFGQSWEERDQRSFGPRAKAPDTATERRAIARRSVRARGAEPR